MSERKSARPDHGRASRSGAARKEQHVAAFLRELCAIGVCGIAIPESSLRISLYLEASLLITYTKIGRMCGVLGYLCQVVRQLPNYGNLSGTGGLYTFQTRSLPPIKGIMSELG